MCSLEYCGQKNKKYSFEYFLFIRARDGTRTRGPDLGKVVLHQLSHSRIGCCVGYICQTHLISYNMSYNLSTLNLKYLCRLKRYEETSTRSARRCQHLVDAGNDRSGAKKLGRKHDAQTRMKGGGAMESNCNQKYVLKRLLA